MPPQRNHKREAQAPVRAHQVVGAEAWSQHEAGEGDRGRHGQQAAARSRPDEEEQERRQPQEEQQLPQDQPLAEEQRRPEEEQQIGPRVVRQEALTRSPAVRRRVR